MSTDLAVINMNLPEHLRAKLKGRLAQQGDAAGGITAGGFPRISLAGGKFHIVQDGVKKLITDPADESLPLMRLEAVIVGWSPHIMKTYYPDDYDADDGAAEPMCRSDDGIKPDADVVNKQSSSCATCKQNAWGSKVSKYSGKDIKACTDGKRIVIIPAQDLNSSALALTITPSALKDWKNYVDTLTGKGIPLDSVVTGFMFDPSANYPKLQFKWLRFLEEDEMEMAETRASSDEVKRIISPRQFTSIRTEEPAVKLVSVTTDTPPVIVGPELPELPEMPPEVITIYEQHAEDSVVAKALLAQYRKPEPKPMPKPVPVDHYQHVPEALKAGITAAVEAAGGPESDAGKAILSSFKPSEDSEPAPAPVKKPKTKTKPKVEAEDPKPIKDSKSEGYAETAEVAGKDLNDLIAQAMGNG